MTRRKTESGIMDEIRRFTILIEDCLPANRRRDALITLERLRQNRRVSQWHHATGFRYWTARSSHPLSDRSLVRSMGILGFCRESEHRSLLIKPEIESWFPDLFRHGLPQGYYIDRSERDLRLGLVRVDAGHTSISRIVARTARLIDRHRRQIGFRTLMTEKRFDLTWIVATRRKQIRLGEALHPLEHSGICLQVRSNPELLHLIAPIQQS